MFLYFVVVSTRKLLFQPFPTPLFCWFHVETLGDVARHGQVEKPATMWSCANARAAKPEAAAPQSACGRETTGQRAAVEVTFYDYNNYGIYLNFDPDV